VGVGSVDELQRAIEDAAGVRILRMTPVRGGDVATASRADLADGGTLFVKTHAAPPPGFFTTEAIGLEWLREPAHVAVPRVVAVSDGDDAGPAYLVLEWIMQGRSTAQADRDFGRALTALHDAGAPSFGREDRRTTGSRGLPNDPQSTWSAFYSACRLVPLARIARDTSSLDVRTIDALERVAARMTDLDDGDAPARLHGDLWAGNRLVDTAGRSWLIDPAAHGGHREFDLAMMRLFGGWTDDCFRAYEEIHPLRDGWRDRVQLHQIAPLVVHAIKFGGAYAAAASAAIARY
jgi:fructosamine-3-kinase